MAVPGGAVVLIWIWYALHAKRLRDGGRHGLAVAASFLYRLAVGLGESIVGACVYGVLAADARDVAAPTPRIAAADLDVRHPAGARGRR